MARIFFVLALVAILLLAGVCPAQVPAASNPGSQAAAPAAPTPAPWQVRTEPATLANGAPAVLYVTAPVKLQTLSGTWTGHKIFFTFDRASRSWYALFGTSINCAPGSYPLVLEGRTDAGATISFQQNFAVVDQNYPLVELKVQHSFTAPSPRLLQRIKKEEILKHRVFQESSETRLWRGPFEAPVREPVTEAFGIRRIFNNELKTEHLGLDYHAPRGTRVRAANSGRVILARPLFFEGNCVIVDHGQGLMTLYMHLSKFKVRKGQRVRRGQLLGLSGATGRATGPHLHLAVRWEGMYLDPARLLKLDLPRPEAPYPALAGARDPAGKPAAAQNHLPAQN